YLPEDVFFCIIERTLNDCDRADGDIEDKNYLNLYVDKKHLPKTYVRFVRGVFFDEDNDYLSNSDVNKILSLDKGALIGKIASGSSGGHGVEAFVFKEGRYQSKTGVVLTAEWIKSNFQTYIIQEKLIQCEFSAQFNPYSANTCRITTLRCPWNGEIVVTKAAMRFGVTDAAIDNMSSGGISLGMGKKGELGSFAYSWEGMRKFDVHPSSHIPFKEQIHPHYNKMCDVVIGYAKKILNFNLISWDVIVDKNGEVKIIEVNLVSQSCAIHQLGFGSFFGEYTEPLIGWISENKQYDSFKHFRTFQ
ncbi:sugar-transfer associated ATP-grasp domain-containing protein, partial [Parabacteroides sp.]